LFHLITSERNGTRELNATKKERTEHFHLCDRGKGQTGGVSVGVVKGTKWRKHALISFVFLSFPFNSPHYFIISEWGMRNERRRERKEERGNCVLFSFNSRTLFYSFVIKWKEHNSPLSFPSPFLLCSISFLFRSFTMEWKEMEWKRETNGTNKKWNKGTELCSFLLFFALLIRASFLSLQLKGQRKEKKRKLSGFVLCFVFLLSLHLLF